jgi:hypothetical protein
MDRFNIARRGIQLFAVKKYINEMTEERDPQIQMIFNEFMFLLAAADLREHRAPREGLLRA